MDLEKNMETEEFSADSADECLHAHYNEDGTIYYHTHGHGEGHDHEGGTLHVHPEGAAHSHSHTQTKAVVNRLSRAIGHLESVKRMVEDERDCADVLVQLAAVRAALSSTAKVILKDHMEHCLTEDSNDAAAQLKALNDAIDKFMN